MLYIISYEKFAQYMIVYTLASQFFVRETDYNPTSFILILNCRTYTNFVTTHGLVGCFLY